MKTKSKYSKLIILIVNIAFHVTIGASIILAAPPPDSHSMPNQSYISLTGNVGEVGSNSFELDYGDGTITIEMNDWNWHDEVSQLIPDERVTVYGKIDNELFQNRIIKVDSIYVRGRNTYYHSSCTCEESGDNAYRYNHYSDPIDGSWVTVTGEVKKVTSQKFIIDTVVRELTVFTDELGYNPLDKFGLQKIKVGDLVSVSGYLDKDFFDKDDITATSVVLLKSIQMIKATKKEDKSL